ncbi:MAG: hypothetical protein ACPIA4_00035 [Flavobacteriales bacterium]|nr:hypothetical protein [Flavobacteriia bacterium]HAP30724.1 hypothetical protein [Flavobacteriales bacterium]|tara:strand:+ start:2081 stop:2611 length:531 start_codon:yes stop_codon:yes gene_type:complete
MNLLKPQSIFIVMVGVTLFFSSCKEEEGCTDLLALNYDLNAAKDNGSCKYLSENFIGVYSINDSITGGMIPGEWEGQRNYTIEIVQNEDNPSQIIIRNWAKVHTYTDNPTADYTQVSAQVDGDSLFVEFQEIINTDGYKAHNSSGKIIGDSIFYDFEYENFFGEVFWGTANGIKIE